MNLYVDDSLPLHWIARDPDRRQLVMFPARANGWADRVPYLRNASALKKVDASNAIGTGWLEAVRG